MSYGQFLIIFVVLFGMSADDQKGLPCSFNNDFNPGVYWPDIDNGVCSASVPGCTTPEGALKLRCCDNGKPSETICTKNDTIQDPRCLGNMKSIVNNVTINLCYELIEDTTYPFDCTTRTGLMMHPKFEDLTFIGGNHTGIWLPIKKYVNTFRYITVNSFYLDPFEQNISSNSSNTCAILSKGVIHEVSCDERHLGICLNFPFIVHQFQRNQLESLLFEAVSDCLETQSFLSEFCSYFELGYNMNLIYFSDEPYANYPYIVIEKSNLRLILQIRKGDKPQSDDTVYLYSSLSSTDWDIFMNTSFPLTQYYHSYETPEVVLTKLGDTIHINKINSENIKWTQKEEYTHYIFCFSSFAPEYRLEKFEVLDSLQMDFKNKSGVIWCDAFDHYLNIIRSNNVTLKDENEFYFISVMIISIQDVPSCDNPTIYNRIINSFHDKENIKHFSYVFNSIDVIKCEAGGADVNISVFWYPENKTHQIDKIEEEYIQLKTEIVDISESLKISKLNFVRHSHFCLEETTPCNISSIVWPITPVNTKTNSCSYCNGGNYTKFLRRECVKNPLGAFWSSDIGKCEKITNHTKLLEEIHKNEIKCKSVVLDNLNNALNIYSKEFNEGDVYLVSKILNLLNDLASNLKKGLQNLSVFVNNLDLIDSEVLEISQEKYLTTDYIMNSSDALYLGTKEKQNSTLTKHCYYTLNFTEHPKATGVILLKSGNKHKTILREFNLTSSELIQEDEFLIEIFFDNEFLTQMRNKMKTSFVKFSIFFDNYLFDANTLSAITGAIFKVLLPDEGIIYSMSFLAMSNLNEGRTCACWKYANSDQKILRSEWNKTVKYKQGSLSYCVFETGMYCTIFSTEYEIEDEYVSIFTVKNAYPLKDEYSITNILTELLYVYFRMNEATYELISIECTDFVQRIFEITVEWKPVAPAESIRDIENEHDHLKYHIEKVSEEASTNKFLDWMILKQFRHKKYCLKDVFECEDSEFVFKTTLVNETTSSIPASYSFIDGALIMRQCRNSESGAYWEEIKPQHLKSCTSRVTENLTRILEDFSDNDANKVLEDLEQLTKSSILSFNSVDVYLLSEILILISHSNQTQNLDIKSLSALASNVQEVDRDVLRNSQLKYNATDTILESLDEILMNSNVTITHVNTHFITLKITNFEKSEGLILLHDGDSYNISVIPGALNNPYSLEKYENFEAGVFFTDFDPDDSVIVSIYFKDVLFVDSKWRHRVSLIFSILLRNKKEISGDIEIVFKNPKGEQEGCAYWKYGVENSFNISGRWRNESEPLKKLEFATCKYNHTTHFAMLISDDNSDPEYLRIVTDIGCSLSIIGLLGILVTGIIFERWRKNLGNIILMNFVFTVAIQICLYYSSSYIHQVINDSNACILIGSLLHYTVVSEFCWMLVIAVLQFKRFVQVLTKPPKCVLLKSLLVGWGLPLIPVLSILFIDSENYTASLTGLCYPSKYGLYFGVWIPIVIITVINVIIFSYIMYSICNRKTECIDTVGNEMIFQWRLAILLFFMLGLTWSFAIASEFVLRDIFAYLFCITSTLQGFIMFLFFIVFNERTRLLYIVLFRRILNK